MSTSRTVVYELIKDGKKKGTVKKMQLTPAQFKETVTTERKRANFKNGGTVRVRIDGVIHRYFGPKNYRVRETTAA